MSYQHKNLTVSRWEQLSFLEQMANIGSEVERALNWQAKNHRPYTQKAAERALELIDLTLQVAKGFPCLKELARIREAIVDYFFGENKFMSTRTSWSRYFSHFTYAARRDY